MFFIDVFFRGLFLLAFLISGVLIVYSIMEYLITKENDDIWKLGFLGIFGLLGIIPGFSLSFFAIFALFFFFGFKD